VVAESIIKLAKIFNERTHKGTL